MNFPRLETNRLVLRAITANDRLAIFRNYSDPEVAKWFFDQPFAHIEQADRIIQTFTRKAVEGEGFTWAILLKASSEFIGTCGYEGFVVGARGEIGFDLAKAHWGKGYMTEALEAIVTYGFRELKLVEVESHTYSHNLRAIGLLEKLGFRIESVDTDSYCCVLTQFDWVRRFA